MGKKQAEGKPKKEVRCMTLTREQASRILEVLYRIWAEQNGMEIVNLKITRKGDEKGESA